MSDSPIYDQVERDLDWTKAQVVMVDGAMHRRDGHQWKGIGHTGSCSPIDALAGHVFMGRLVVATIIINASGVLVADLEKYRGPYDASSRVLLVREGFDVTRVFGGVPART